MSIIEKIQEKTIDKMSPLMPRNERERIKKITNNITMFSLIIFQGIATGIIFLKIIPNKYGWDYAQTSILCSIFLILLVQTIMKPKSL